MKSRLSARRWVTGVAVLALTLTGVIAQQPAVAATTGTSPHWFTGRINIVRFSGSETTYYVMTRLSNLFNQSSIFGCTLQSSDLRTCNPNGDTADTDTLDNWDRNEILQGAGIGSSGGVSQLCGGVSGGLQVDAARSSRGFSSTSDCSDTVFKQLAKDALVGLVFPNENMPAGSAFGNVAAGWRPGDPLNGPYSGVPFTDISNVGGTSSIAYRIWCDTGPNAINDWGQLTDPGQPVGSGAAIGVPIVIWGVNTLSGTYKNWNTYIGCDQNTKSTQAHIVQENNGPQIRNVSASQGGGVGTVATQQMIAQSLYNMSFGPYQSNAYTRGNGIATRVNGTAVTSARILTNQVTTGRTLYNVYRTSTLRASVAGFINWISVNDPSQHGINLTTGKNYQTEIDNAISTQFGFPRVYDTLIPASHIADLTS